MNTNTAKKTRARREWGMLVLALCLSIPLSWFATAVSWYTHGEVYSGGIAVLTILGHALCIGWWIWRPAVGIRSLLILAILCIVLEGAASLRLWKLHTEAQRFTHWVFAEMAKSGKPPTDISPFVFAPGMSDYFRYTPGEGAAFAVNYWMDSPGTTCPSAARADRIA